MVKKTGLGKGLDALFSMPVEEEKLKEDDTLKNLKIIEVEPNREQPRKRFDEDSLKDLADSIERYGVIQPIVVTPKEGYYAIVAGERRWRAAKIAGLVEIPAIIREYDERKNKEIALIENIQREDLNAYEKASGIKALMEDYNLTQEEIAKVLGKSRSSIANSVRILNLDPRVLEFAKEGKLTEGHCKALMAITDSEKQYAAAVRMIEKDTFQGFLSTAEKGNSNQKESTSSENDYSTTNIQVENVDEADITKTDGNYVYSISENNVLITNVENPENMKIEASLK